MGETRANSYQHPVLLYRSAVVDGVRWPWSNSTVFWNLTDSVSSYRTRNEIGRVLTGSDEDERLLNAKGNLSNAYGAIKKNALAEKAKSQGNTGHPFSSLKYTCSLPEIQVSYNGTDGHRYVYRGTLKDWTNDLSTLQPVCPSINSNYYGSIAISQTSPTNPYANLAQSLWELRKEGLPSIPGSTVLGNKHTLPASSGSEYLNVQFGIKPLIGDVEDTLKAITHSGEILRNFHKHSNRMVKRKFAFKPIVSTTTSTGNGTLGMTGGTPSIPYANANRIWSASTSANLSCPYTDTVTTSQTYWFSGSYIYASPKGGSILEKLERYEQDAHRLLGLRLTPELLWNVGPWSWLVDWKFNIGAVIGNASNLHSDGLVLKYAFLMCTTEVVRVRTYRGVVPRTTTPFDYIFTWKSIRKDRVAATPYGFGTNPASFTTKQWSILGALGLTKSEKALF